MGNAEKTIPTTNSQSDNIDLYKNQLNYEKYIAKKMSVYKILFVIASVVSLVTMFIIPMFGYRVNGNVNKNQEEIYGDYSLFYLIQKFFRQELGENTLYNIGMLISLCVVLILSIYLVVGAVLNFVAKMSNVPKLLGKDKLETGASVMVVFEFVALLCCRINVNGAAENLIGFWILILTAIVMICTSIPLSTYRENK